MIHPFRMHIIKAFVALTVALSICIVSIGQPAAGTDSLERTLDQSRGRARVDLLNQLTYAYITNDSAKVSSYNSEALTLSHAISYPQGEARAYTYRGVAEYLSGQ